MLHMCLSDTPACDRKVTVDALRQLFVYTVDRPALFEIFAIICPSVCMPNGGIIPSPAHIKFFVLGLWKKAVQFPFSFDVYDFNSLMGQLGPSSSYTFFSVSSTFRSKPFLFFSFSLYFISANTFPAASFRMATMSYLTSRRPSLPLMYHNIKKDSHLQVHWIVMF